MKNSSFYSDQELKEFGFKYIGANVQISRNAKFYGIGNISIDHNSRIDDFCILSSAFGEINIGKYVHLAIFTSIQGNGKITIGDFVGLGARVTILSSSDDFSGENMANSCIPDEFKGVKNLDVDIQKHSIIGAGSIILPGITLHQGAAIGALSLVNKDCEEFFIYHGNPIKKLMPRSRNLLNKEADFLNSLSK